MLLIDCGNTRLKWAKLTDGQLSNRVAVSLGDDPLASLSAELDPGLGRVLVANVAGAGFAQDLAALVKAQAGIEPEFAEVASSGYGIDCAYREPATLGVDRWLAMIACRDRCDAVFVVVGVGTALTLDAVDADGHHLGGLILPGERLMLEALAANTGQIDLVPQAGLQPAGLELLGRSTEQAVGHGVRLSLAAAVDRAIARVTAGLSQQPQVFLTGGGAGALADWLETGAELRADLVLEGLAILARAQGR